MNSYLQLGDCPELEVWATKYLKEGLSFKALNSDGQMIGLIINGLMHKNAVEEEDEEPCQHPQFAIILRMMSFVDTQFNIFDRFPQFERGLDAKIMSVNDAYRGVGICKALTQRTIEHMLELELRLFHVLCSSHYSALLCERLGFEKMHEMLYSEYLVDGVQPLRPAKPHEAVRVYARVV